MNPKLVFIPFVGIVILVLLLALSPFTTVNAGSVGVVTQFGAVEDTVLDEGFHMISPFAAVTEVDVRVQKYEVQSSAASKDLQSVVATVAMNYHLDQTHVVDLYRSVGLNYGEALITPAIQEAVKASTAQYTAEELITKRAQVKDVMLVALTERLRTNHIIVTDLSITNFQFSQSFEDAIEAKVTAEQDALAAQNKLAQIEFEAQQSVVRAQAEAESIRIQAEAITSQGGAEYVELQRIEAWRAGGAQVPNTYITGSSNENFLLQLTQ